MLYAVAVFAPLLGSIVAGLLGRQIGDRASQAVTIICMIVAAVCGTISFIPVLQGHAEPGFISLGEIKAAPAATPAKAEEHETVAGD